MAKKKRTSGLLKELDYAEAALFLNVAVATIKAVEEVESNGSGFLPDGSIKILYEPYVFGRLTNNKYDKETVTINNEVYPLSLQGKWDKEKCKYGKENIQHTKRQAASKLNAEAANKACSWGKFQILGTNYIDCGCATVFEMMQKMLDERLQLKLFCNFIKNRNLAATLRKKDWTAFAKAYNGSQYYVNKYDERLAKAYAKYAGMSSQL